jgi:hypothetical protein
MDQSGSSNTKQQTMPGAGIVDNWENDDNAKGQPPLELSPGRGFGQRELKGTLKWLQWREAPNVRVHRPSKRLDLTSLASSAAWYVTGVA